MSVLPIAKHVLPTYRVVDDERYAVPRVDRPEEWLKVIPVPEADVRQDCTERQVGGYQVQSVGRRKERRLREMSEYASR